MNIQDLQFADYNPREISEHDFASLKRSMKRFGDLSRIIKNVKTGRLVGGHQRVRAMMARGHGHVTITERFPQPNSVGTIALGHVQLEGSDEQFAYREVDWDENMEKAANIAANRIGGQFDQDLLAKLTHELEQADPELNRLTGHTEQEINNLLQQSSAPEAEPYDERESVHLRFTAEQMEVVNEAIGNMQLDPIVDSNENTDKKAAAVWLLARNHLDRVYAAQAAGNEKEQSSAVPSDSSQ